jgi:flavin-dependent dehydrogenase
MQKNFDETTKNNQTPNDETWDVVIAGAGVGGMALSILLAKQGYKVVMVERKPPIFFRLGESLDWEAPVFLKRLGLPIEKLVEEGKAVYKHGAIASSAYQPGVEASFGLNFIFKFLMTLVGRRKPTIHANRELIDVDLMDMAEAAGVKIVVNKVSKIEIKEELVTGIVLEDGTKLKGKFYVDATGRAAMFRRVFGIGETTIGPRKVVVRARFPHKYDNTGTRILTDDFLSTPLWIWDINVSQDITDIGVVLAEKDFVKLKNQYKNLPDLFLAITQRHSYLNWLKPLVKEDTELWTCTFQDMVAHKSNGENWIAVGEAVFVVDGLLSSGFTSALRTGFFASSIVGDALAKKSTSLCKTKRYIYHEKAFTHVRTIDQLLNIIWYEGRIREHYSLMLNVISVLFFNFNLNHIHTRYIPKTIFGLKMLKLLHKAIDRFIPAYNKFLMDLATKLGKRNPKFIG